MSTQPSQKTGKPVRVIVFDSHSWSKTGDIGDNSQFYKEAIVIEERKHVSMFYSEVHDVVDVQFLDGRVSKGHFKTSVKFL